MFAISRNLVRTSDFMGRGKNKNLQSKVLYENNLEALLYRDLDDEMVFVSGLTESGMKIDLKDQTEHHKKMFELNQLLCKLNNETK